MNDIFTYAWKVFSKNIYYIIGLSFPFLLAGVLANVILEQVNDLGKNTIYAVAAIQLIMLSAYISALILFMSQDFLNDLQSIQVNIVKSFIYAPLLILTLIICYSPLILIASIFVISGSSLIISLPLLIVELWSSLVFEKVILK